MKYQVNEDHKPNNMNPIRVSKGETVKLGKISDEEDGWNNWIYCYSLNNESEGWIPEQIIQIENEYGILLDNYCAKELNVSKGEAVVGELELNGWVWCSIIKDFEEGWLPKEKIMQM
jgi:Variant SH3 domain.